MVTVSNRVHTVSDRIQDTVPGSPCDRVRSGHMYFVHARADTVAAPGGRRHP